MRWILYNTLFTVGYLLMLPSFIRRMRRRGGYRAHFRQRFGRYEPDVAAALQRRPGRLWVHAVSVGEAFVAAKLLEGLRRRCPGLSIVLSTTSSTGHAVCERLLAPDDVLLYFPIDAPAFVRRALNHVRPRAVVLTESEIWPNFLRACARREIPVVLVNGRISDRSFPKYRALRAFFGPILRTFRILLVQSERDRDRLLEIGARPERVQVTGSMKFDQAPPAPETLQRVRSDLDRLGFPPDGPLLLGASTWPGEETVLLQAYRTLRTRHPSLRLVLVPRHRERGDEVEAAIRAEGFPCRRRSRDASREPADGRPPPSDTVLLADTTGELLAFHALADLVFVGKTLEPHHGGQNMIEPASLGKPVLVGPHTENFAAPMALLREARAIRELASSAELTEALDALLSDASARLRLGAAARAAVATHAGALDRSVEALCAALAPDLGRDEQHRQGDQPGHQ